MAVWEAWVGSGLLPEATPFQEKGEEQRYILPWFSIWQLFCWARLSYTQPFRHSVVDGDGVYTGGRRKQLFPEKRKTALYQEMIRESLKISLCQEMIRESLNIGRWQLIPVSGKFFSLHANDKHNQLDKAGCQRHTHSDQALVVGHTEPGTKHTEVVVASHGQLEVWEQEEITPTRRTFEFSLTPALSRSQ